MKNKKSLLPIWIALLASVAVAMLPNLASAAGGSKSGGGGGGGGSVQPFEGRVTGYVTAIDYTNSTITIGASYYGNGKLTVNSSTKISMDNVNCGLDGLVLGDWVEARYDINRVATRLSGTSSATP